MVVVNVQIGVVCVVYFLCIMLLLDFGWDVICFVGLFIVLVLLWLVGGLFSQLLFEGGKLKVGVDFVQVGYVVVQVSYWQIVFIVFQEV